MAIYFTAGLALSAFAPTAGFAASMPGFAGGGFLGTGVGAGATAGTGLFTKAATALGLGGGLAEGAAGLAAPAAAGGAFPGMVSSTAAVGGGAAAGTAAATMPVAAASYSLTDKLLLAKVGTDVAGALFGPTPQEEYEAAAIAAAKFRGAFYGMEADGSTAQQPAGTQQAQPAQQAQPVQARRVETPQQAAPPANQQPQQRAMGKVPEPMNTVAGASSGITPEEQQLLAGRERRELFPKQRQPVVVQTSGPGQMQSNIPLPSGLFSAAENVRYV